LLRLYGGLLVVWWFIVVGVDGLFVGLWFGLVGIVGSKYKHIKINYNKTNCLNFECKRGKF
jgi:hypothetical protein